MNEHEIRTRLAEHLGIDRERIGIESGPAVCSVTVLGADDETYRVAAKWLHDNGTFGVYTSAHATILASDTHCSLCADRGISNRLRFREVRMGGYMRRYSKCPDRFCPNGKRERCALIPLGPPKKHKPKGFTGPDLGRRRAELLAETEGKLSRMVGEYMSYAILGQALDNRFGTTHESSGAVRVPVPGELRARNAGYATIDDIKVAYPGLCDIAGKAVPAESDDECLARLLAKLDNRAKNWGES